MLINFKQIEQGLELKKMLTSYDAGKVLTGIAIPTAVVSETVSALVDTKIQLANTSIVEDVLHKLVITADGEVLDREKYTVEHATGIITPVEGFTFEVEDPHSVTVSYFFLPAEEVGKYNVNQVIDLIKVALADTSVIEKKVNDLELGITADIDKITSKLVQDRVKVVANATVVEGVSTLEIVPPMDQQLRDKLDQETPYMLFTVDNLPVFTTEGKYATYTLSTGLVNGTIAKFDEASQVDPVYTVITEPLEVKSFAVGSFTFAELPEDYLLDNDEFAASSYQAAINKIVSGMAGNKTLIDALTTLISEEVQVNITKLTEILEGNGSDKAGLIADFAALQAKVANNVEIVEYITLTGEGPHTSFTVTQTIDETKQVQITVNGIVYDLKWVGTVSELTTINWTSVDFALEESDKISVSYYTK